MLENGLNFTQKIIDLHKLYYVDSIRDFYDSTKNGAGIFFQCIKNGIPALILPDDYDQYDYAIRGVEAGVALQAPKDKSQKIAQAFEQLLARKD